MAQNNFFPQLVYSFFSKLFSVKENKSVEIGTPKKILIIRPHNQLGDLLAGVSLLRAVKETFPECRLTLIVSPFNYTGLVKNKFIDRLAVFDKLKIYNPLYFIRFYRLLKEEYDLAVVPVTVSISFTSNLIARISNSKIRIGPNSLNGKENKSAFFFDRRVNIDWRKHPDSNVSERSLDILRPFGINTKDYRSEISFDENDVQAAKSFLESLPAADKTRHEKFSSEAKIFLIGFHTGAGKIPNRWSLDKYIQLMNELIERYPVKFYLTGSTSDKEEISYIKSRSAFDAGLFINRKIPEVAALISLSDLFISNDTGIMHVAGATETPQISIFGPTNPFNWAPVGKNKYFIRKSELIDDVSVSDVFEMCTGILDGKRNEINYAE